MRADLAELFELDPRLTHLNHGAFGAVPRSVREAQDAARRRIEAAPTRAYRDELPRQLAAVREQAAAFVGVAAEDAALVRNVTEAVGVVLQALAVGPGDDVVVSDHGYPTVGWSVQARGAALSVASFAVDADEDAVVDAFVRALTPTTRLVVVDHVTSPTALVLPVARVAAAVAPVPVLVDGAHVPGAVPDVDVAALGAAYWVGNLHKWAYVPRSSAVLWVAPGDDAAGRPRRHGVRPLVTSWSHGEAFPASFDLQGTVDHSAWLAIPSGLAAWHDLGGWSAVARSAAVLADGAALVRDALGTPDPYGGLPAPPCLRVVALPDGTGGTPEAAEALWQRLYAAGFVVPPVSFAGRGLLRLAAAPYTDASDVERLAAVLPRLLDA